MKNLKINEKQINEVCDELGKFVRGFIYPQMNILKDENADMFDRFMAYSQFTNIISTINFINYVFKKNLVDGFSLNSKILQTESCIKNGWSMDSTDKDIQDHPFFEEPKNENFCQLVEDLLKKFEDVVEKD